MKFGLSTLGAVLIGAVAIYAQLNITFPELPTLAPIDESKSPISVVENGTVLQIGTPFVVGLTLIGLGAASLIGGAIGVALDMNNVTLPELPTIPGLPNPLDSLRALGKRSIQLDPQGEDFLGRIFGKHEIGIILEGMRNMTQPDCMKRHYCLMYSCELQGAEMNTYLDQLHDMLFNSTSGNSEGSFTRNMVSTMRENILEGVEAARAKKDCSETFADCHFSVRTLLKKLHQVL